jgi:two-component system sensor histidine kinase RegB
VTLKAVWSRREAKLLIQDDGPGFAPDILPFLGEPYLSSREEMPPGRDEGEHMGLGVFIARTLLARTGARVSFANRPEGGAEVAVTWTRSALESLPTPTATHEEATHHDRGIGPAGAAPVHRAGQQ